MLPRLSSSFPAVMSDRSVHNAPGVAHRPPYDASVVLGQVGAETPLAQPFWLPNDVWRVTGGFSSRTDVLNLRTVSRELNAQLVPTITSMTLTGHDDLLSFIEADTFAGVKDLHLIGSSDDALQALITHLHAHPRTGLTLRLSGRDFRQEMGPDFETRPVHASAETLRRLSALPLKALRLDLGNTDWQRNQPAQLAALAACRYPVEVFAEDIVSRDELVAMFGIPTLTKVRVEYGPDALSCVASQLSVHAALQVLDLRTWAPIPLAIEALAAIPTLRELSIGGGEQAIFSESAAAALAQLPALETLMLGKYARFPEAAFASLSRIQTLRTLAIRYQPEMRQLANMVSLTSLSIDFERSATKAFDLTSATSIATLPKLETLALHHLSTDADSLGVLCQSRTLSKLTIVEIARDFDDAVLAVLLANTRLTELTIRRSYFAAPGSPDRSNDERFQKTIDSLSRHPTLQRLRIFDQGKTVFERGVGEWG